MGGCSAVALLAIAARWTMESAKILTLRNAKYDVKRIAEKIEESKTNWPQIKRWAQNARGLGKGGGCK